MRMSVIGSTVLFAMFVGVSAAEHPVKFEPRLLTVDANEGCDVADFDRDGKLDVVAGRNWYRNGEWVPRPVRCIEDWNGYVRSNGDWAHDCNGDNYPDVIAMDFTSGEVYWYENPGAEGLEKGHLWSPRLLGDTRQKNNEACYLIDIVGDSTPEWFANQWNKNNPTLVWTLTTEQREVKTKQGRKAKDVTRQVPAIQKHAIGDINGHGVGFGDINNDGRDDIVFGLGWYERPAGDPLQRKWIHHADWELHGSCPMLVYDVDGDGINDLVWSDSHDYGIYLWRGAGTDADGKLQFEKTTIDKSFSQAHCLHLADLNGDGRKELITGKRVLAHNGGDPGSDEPPIMRYYVWNAESKSFKPYTINEGQVGAGLQIRTADLDGDGDIDIVVAGKEGTQILFNQRR
ncbi:MAG: FG-GAP repeat domain-containing protein [Planctomycetota bacterium]